LVAKELRDQLDRRPDLVGEQRLFTTVEEEVGTLTEAGGAAAMVQRFSAEALEGVDLVFFCGPVAANRPLLAAIPASARTILMSPDAAVADAPPLVAGVNLSAGPLPALAASPHAGTILLAHLLHPLLPLGLRRAEATLLQPASIFPAVALDQLFEQARSLLTFQPLAETTYWQRQLAFNLLATDGPADELLAQLETVLGGAREVTAQVVQAGVFHGFAASLHLALEPDPGVEAVREAYAHRPALRWADEEPLGPTDAAAAPEVLLGHVRADCGRPGSYWLWSVMDNLTRGGALNAVAIAEAMVGA
jgi:aspartate-semialdehyde dehydrogenase